MNKFLIAATLVFICVAGVTTAFAGETVVSTEEDVTIITPGKEQPVTESDLVGRISDNIRTSEHYDRHDPMVVYGDWIDHSNYPSVQRSE
ncbi:MAG: hypothetical protein LUC93_15245 [Planctomycetaceae bacterium]|nr:hypothetical protein [Planctomycetaceae bacterium]